MRAMVWVGPLLAVTAVAAIARGPEPPLSRGDAMREVGSAVDSFIACSRAERPANLGKPYQDKNWHIEFGYGSFMYCGAVVHWDAQMAKDMKQCLDKRSFSEDVDRIPSKKRGLRRYNVQYDCNSFWLSLGVDVTGHEGKVVSMDEGDKP
jgi:hypothetical protein